MSYLSLSLKTAASASQNVLSSVSSNSISFDVAGLALDVAEGFSVSLDAHEEKVLASTRRVLSYDATTQFQITQPYNNISQETTWRIFWTGTGTNPGFRTRRTLTISATTTVNITRLNDIVSRITFSDPIGSAVKVNDILLLEKQNDIGQTSPFTAGNQGIPVRIVGVTSNFVDVEDNGVFVNETSVLLGINYLTVLKIFSSSGVQVTDAVKIDSSIFNYGNRGTYKVIFVSADYIDIEAPSLVPEIVTGVTDGFRVFSNSIYYLAIKAKGSIKISIDEKELDLSLLNDTAIFAASVECSEIVVENKTDGPLSVEGLWCSSSLNGNAC